MSTLLKFDYVSKPYTTTHITYGTNCALCIYSNLMLTICNEIQAAACPQTFSAANKTFEIQVVVPD